MMHYQDLTTNQRFSLLAVAVASTGLVWTATESLSRQLSASLYFQIFAFLAAILMLGLGAAGMAMAKSAFAEHKYVNYKALRFVSGILIFVFAFIVSMSASIHNVYFRMTSNAMREQEVNEVYRDLSQVNADANAIISKAVNNLNAEVEARLADTISEAKNLDRPGTGVIFDQKKKALERSLGGVTLNFNSSRDGVSVPSKSAMDDFEAKARAIKNQRIVEKRVYGKEITDQLTSADFQQLLADLALMKKDFNPEPEKTIVSLLKRAYAIRNDLAKRVSLLKSVIGQSKASDVAPYPEVPPSVELHSLPYFWGEVWAGKDRSEGGVVSTSKVRWAILFGVVFELAFAVFFYFGLLDRREY
ncbi:hypothetical protein [Undibacterium pigrum]|uniref:Uncharacterized protein n=1 Tax=Undibacterium pigrum TaxID=401470 RepID=A0A318IQ46_9BURK|nr:hypothetical protein [Undibacterium pigrum]PXX35288.1 hypothetical protein DFR42_12123 [Undibacterium pigrum]